MSQLQIQRRPLIIGDELLCNVIPVTIENKSSDVFNTSFSQIKQIYIAERNAVVKKTTKLSKNTSITWRLKRWLSYI